MAQPSKPIIITAIDAVTATTESGAINIEKAKKVTFLFTRANHSSGSSLFDVDVSVDGTTFVDYNKLIDNVANTNAQTLTRVANKSLASNTSAVLSMDLQHDSYKEIKVKVTETTDGTHTAKVIIER